MKILSRVFRRIRELPELQGASGGLVPNPTKTLEALYINVEYPLSHLLLVESAILGHARDALAASLAILLQVAAPLNCHAVVFTAYCTDSDPEGSIRVYRYWILNRELELWPKGDLTHLIECAQTGRASEQFDENYVRRCAESLRHGRVKRPQ